MFCEQCGFKNPDDSMFCENCGARLDGSGGASVNPAPEPSVQAPPPVPTQQPVTPPPAPTQRQMPPQQPPYQQPGSGYRQQGMSQGNMRNAPGNKKSPLPIIIIVIAAVIVISGLAVAGVFLFKKLGPGKKDRMSEEGTESILDNGSDNTDEDVSGDFGDTQDIEPEDKGNSFDEDKPGGDEDPFPEDKDEKERSDDGFDNDFDDTGDTDSIEGNLDEDTDNELLAHAKEMSTDEDAYATEFDWFIDIILNDGTMNGQVVTDKSQVMQIYKDAEALNGGWKCFMCGQKNEYFNSPERYMHADMKTDGNDFDLTLDWGYFIPNDGSEGSEEEGSSSFKGKWDPDMGSVSVYSDSGNVDIQCFYESTDNGEQYAFGTMTWPSGEVDNIAFMRGPRGY